MLKDLLEKNDGLGRQLRPGQIEALKWIHANWKNGEHLMLQASVGAGKSAILRSVQRYYGGSIVTSQNSLIEQYVKDYPELNKVIGKMNYNCHVHMNKCGYSSDAHTCRGSELKRCPLRESRDNMISKQNIYNAMSAVVLRKLYKMPSHINLIDEAHTLLSMVRMMGTYTIAPHNTILRKIGLTRDQLTNEIRVLKYLEAKKEELTKKFETTLNPDTKLKYEAEIENLEHTIEFLGMEPEKYVIQPNEGRIYVFPVIAPRYVLDRIIGHTGILTSATLVPHDIEELTGRPAYKFLSLPSEIPADKRQVIIPKNAQPMNYASIDPIKIADMIRKIYKSNPVATLVHVTYSLASRIAQYLPEAKVHTQEDKKEVLQQFLTKGGILLGAGMSEGLDLKDDLCRQQIIVQVQFPNINDLWVQKRKALMDGEIWYKAEAYKTFAQQVGRSTRHKNDFSITYVLDSRIKFMIKEWQSMGILPSYLKDSIMYE